MRNEPTFERGQLVLVHWLDAVTHSVGWDSLSRKEMRALPCVSVGFVLKQDELSITIAADTDPKKPGKGHVNRAITIPLGMVTEIKELV